MRSHHEDVPEPANVPRQVATAKFYLPYLCFFSMMQNQASHITIQSYAKYSRKRLRKSAIAPESQKDVACQAIETVGPTMQNIQRSQGRGTQKRLVSRATQEERWYT
jgi:hypothetical protein